MNNILLGEILALLAASTGCVSSIIISNLGKKINSTLIGYVRMLIVTPIMIVFALITDGPILFQTHFSDLIWIIISGVIGFFVTDIFLFKAFAIAGAQQTNVIMCFTPALSTVLSILFFSELPTGKQFAGITLTIAGILIMVLQDSDKKGSWLSYGLLCAILASVFQSASDLAAKASVANIPYITVASLRGVSGTIAWLIYAPFVRKKLFVDMPVLKTPKNFILLTISVLVSTWLGTTMAMGSLKYAPAGIATSLKQITPILLLPYDYFVLKKRSVQSILGTFIAVAGVILIFS